jgi:predicted RNA-binding Zn-ribbon protein involved in translation (DUF1610 family)
MAKAACPSCGASIEFKSTVSILAVCPYCQSTLIRHDLNLENLGRMADLKLDGSPLQLGVTGVFGGTRFTAVGRIQLQYGRGVWNEWHLLFDDRRSGWLGEAQGLYAVTFLASVPSTTIPPFEKLAVGNPIQIKDRFYTVTNIDSARCVAGEGELPFKVGAGYEAPVVDLQADGMNMATLDYSDDSGSPLIFTGRYVEFATLKLQGLREFDGW